MNFRYRKFPVDKNNCPFPNKNSSLRPVIQIDFSTPKGNFGYYVLIDSGADYCIFHATIGEELGLDIKKGALLIFFGTSGEPQRAYFHKVTFKIGGHEHTCMVGFSYDMEKLAYGLLGQEGFFDQWIVKFELCKENVELKEIPRKNYSR
ncbi:retropepsin-like domain-containing protein [Candidatus Microgenomates bacterium]|nr:retropepsin-like domain-containing protein [Candidatus Microgenomates bacterium]